MGLLDLPAPLFGWLDARLEPLLPPAGRLLLWGVAAGVLSMLLYRALSPQAAIARGKAELVAARRTLEAHDGAFDQAWPLMRRLLAIALRQVGRTGGPALIASLPVLSLLAWISTAYGYAYPSAGQAPRIETAPVQVGTRWLDGSPPQILLGEGPASATHVALERPVPVVHKPRWWNALLGNPAGYLPESSAVDQVRIDLPAKQYLDFGPGWMRGWLPLFFAALLVASIMLKVAARIE